jgi:hypothetical protein
MFTPGLAIFFLATILRHELLATCVAYNCHACGVRAGISNILSADSLVSFYSTVRRSREMNRRCKTVGGLLKRALRNEAKRIFKACK